MVQSNVFSNVWSSLMEVFLVCISDIIVAHYLFTLMQHNLASSIIKRVYFLYYTFSTFSLLRKSKTKRIRMKQQSRIISSWWLEQKKPKATSIIGESSLRELSCRRVTLSRGFMGVVQPWTWIFCLSGHLVCHLWAAEPSGHVCFQPTHLNLIVVIVMNGWKSKFVRRLCCC